MDKPEDIPQDVWDFAEKVESVWRELPPQSAVEHHARALMAARDGGLPREWQAHELEIGKVYECANSQKPLKFVGHDVYWGEHTLMFYNMRERRNDYIAPHNIGRRLAPRPAMCHKVT